MPCLVRWPLVCPGSEFFVDILTLPATVHIYAAQNRFSKAVHQTWMALGRQLANNHKQQQAADAAVVGCDCCPVLSAGGGWLLHECRYKAGAKIERRCQVALRCRKVVLKINHCHLLRVKLTLLGLSLWVYGCVGVWVHGCMRV